MNFYKNYFLRFSYINSLLPKIYKVLEIETKEDKFCNLKMGGSIEDIFGKNGIQAYRSSGKLDALFFIQQGNDKVVMISNAQDGWNTLCHIISKKLKCDVYIFSVSDDDIDDAYNGFTLVSNGKDDRVVYSMKDPMWKFFQQGSPVWFEDCNFYSKRIIKDRMNKNLITSYCKKLGLLVDEEDFWTINEKSLLFSYSPKT